MKVIEANQLSKWYGEVMGLNSFSVEIGEGITGLIGPNGAGKTTFIKIITGLIHQDKGEIRVLGEDGWNNPSLNKKMGYCPEHEALYPWMTAAQFLTTMVRMNGYGRDESKRMAREALSMVGLEDMDRKIKSYSKGMRQKVKVAQALAHDPELLILDEPLSGTDPVGRNTIINLIREMAGRGKNVVVSSHVLYEIERLTEQVVLIDRGRMLAEGNIHEIRGLIDQHPHTVLIKTKHAREMGRELLREGHVINIEFSREGNLLVKTRDPNKFYQELPKIVSINDFEVEEFMSPDDNLQAVFKYLVKK